VRELRNVVERAFVGCDGSLITLTIRPGTPMTTVAARGVDDPGAFTVPIGLPLRDVERQFVLRTLAAENNNKTRAADRLEISTKTLHNMLRRWGLLHRPLD
jgi:DNA-binding NtrC family response regulator